MTSIEDSRASEFENLYFQGIDENLYFQGGSDEKTTGWRGGHVVEGLAGELEQLRARLEHHPQGQREPLEDLNGSDYKDDDDKDYKDDDDKDYKDDDDKGGR